MLPDEVIIVKDGPLSKRHNDLLNLFSSKRTVPINVIENEKNLGLAESLNKGIIESQFPIIVRADADDLNYCDRFEKLISYFKNNPEVHIVGSNVIEIDHLTGKENIKFVPGSHSDIIRYMAKRNPMNHMSAAFKRSVWQEVGGYPQINLREDYGFWVLAAAKGYRFHNINESLVQVNGGHRMVARRGGLRYALDELKFQKFMSSFYQASTIKRITIALSRITIFLLPLKVRSLIYRFYLR